MFSRAIDVVPDWREGLEALMELGVTRVLTSGQAPAAPQGADTIRAMRAYAAGRIQILPGCGVRPDNAAALLAESGCEQLHGSFQTAAPDLAAGTGPVSFAAPGGSLAVTDPAALRALAAALAQNPGQNG